MKYLILVAALCSSQFVMAQHLVILSKEKACDTESKTGCKTDGVSESAFYEGYVNALPTMATGQEFKLETPPLQWGRTVRTENYGRLAAQVAYRNGFVTDLDLQDLKPHHNYRLCLNGRPDLPGNDLLPTPVPGHEAEKYYDFLTISTDETGEYHANLAILLKPGEYQVRFYVKDTDDFKIILYHDYFKFTVN